MTDTYPPNPQYPQAPQYPQTPPNSPWSPEQDPYAAYSGPHPGQRYGGQLPYQPYATPQWGMPQLGTAKPSAYWPLSVVGFLFSFLLGGIALYFSSQVGKRWNRGDVAGARKASRTAVVLSILGIVLGLGAAVYLVSTGSSGY
jgi:hypothetical protein